MEGIVRQAANSSLIVILISDYKSRHRAELENDPEFAHWLENHYQPIAGGWHY